MSDPVFQLQSDIYGRLMADPAFGDVLVLNNEAGIIGEDLEKRLRTFTSKNGKKGAAVVVDRPVRVVEKPDAPGPEFVVVVPISIVEMPLLNRATGGTGVTIEELCTAVLSLAHGWRTSPQVGQIYVAQDAVTPVVGTDKVIVAEVQLRSRMRLATISRVGTPVISGSAGAVQIGCNTPDSTIYYTTDGSFPWSGNPTAVLFGITLLTESGAVIVTEDGNPLNISEPFTVAAGTHVRAAAYAASKQGSDVAAANL